MSSQTEPQYHCARCGHSLQSHPIAGNPPSRRNLSGCTGLTGENHQCRCPEFIWGKGESCDSEGGGG